MTGNGPGMRGSWLCDNPTSPSTVNKLAEEWSWSLWCNWAGKGSEGEKNNMPELDKEWDRPCRNAFYKAGFWAAEAVGRLDLSQSTVQLFTTSHLHRNSVRPLKGRLRYFPALQPRTGHSTSLSLQFPICQVVDNNTYLGLL